MNPPVIIVGAPRSGTNILRDVLTSVPGYETWPCDEINLVWKHHNRAVPHDELTPDDARPEVTRYLRRTFERLERRTSAHTVVEKTCATSLRVGFVAAAFPDARFVFIKRDGLDAAASTIQRWDAPFDARYVANKLRYAPKSDLPFYAGQFIAKRRASRRAAQTAGRATGTRHVESWWGPKPHDHLALRQHHSLDELAVLQWKRCVDATLRDLEDVPVGQVHEIAYETFVHDPAATMSDLMAFLGSPQTAAGEMLRTVTPTSIGKGRATFDQDSTQRLTALASDTLNRLGYA